MDYKVIEKPLTPPESPAPLPESSRPFELSMGETRNGATFRPPSPRLDAARAPWVSTMYPEASSSTSSPRSHRAVNGLSSDSAMAGPSTAIGSLPSPVYPTPSTLSEQVQQQSRILLQKTRVVLALASQTVIDILPSTPNRSTSSTASETRRSSLPNGHQPHGRRLLTTHPDKDKERSGSDPDPLPAWARLLDALNSLLPSSSGPSRIRTRTRRLLFLLGIVALLCYVFSNTLQEAYYSAAMERRQQYLEDLETERLGMHLSEYKEHPIQELLKNAKKDWEDKVARQSETVEEGMAEYKRRYSRDPPTGYAEWFEYAKESGSVLVDEYDSLMASLEPFWAIEAAELRRRTFQIGMQPSFALVHVEEGPDGGTFWDANEDEALIKPFGVERARGFERMVRPFVGKPGMTNMVFAINELAEPRVLVPWEEKTLLDDALKNGTTVNLRQFSQLPGRSKKFFPNPVWTGDGTTWDVFMRTCPPASAARKVMTTMTNSVVHLADVVHVAYTGARIAHGRKKTDKIIETLNDGKDVEVQINPKRAPKRRSVAAQDQLTDAAVDALVSDEPMSMEEQRPSKRPGQGGIPTKDAFLNTPDFMFNANFTTLSHEMLCRDTRMHETQGQFCSDFRNLDTLYPVFSPSTMPGFSDVVIPSHYYAATGPKYHLEAHLNKPIKKAVKDPQTGKWTQSLVKQTIPAWHTRRNKIFWRGSTTGGGNNPAGRQLTYQRHRFLRLTSENSTDPLPIVLPAASNASADMSFVEMPAMLVNEQTMDVAFTSLDGCGHDKVCDAVKNGKYRMGDKVPLLDITKYKMLIDIDGMAYSARFMALMESGAAVMKSTIYSEYFSDQIQPWYHFIPVSLMYSEIYNIYSFFLGQPPKEAASHGQSSNGKKGQSSSTPDFPSFEPHTSLSAPNNMGANEAELQAMGERGQDWQLKFGKTKDMEIYCYRLALEWGRLWQRDGFAGTF